MYENKTHFTTYKNRMRNMLFIYVGENPKKAIPRTQQGSEKGLYRFSFGGMSSTIPHGDFTRDCLTQ